MPAVFLATDDQFLQKPPLGTRHSRLSSCLPRTYSAMFFPALDSDAKLLIKSSASPRVSQHQCLCEGLCSSDLSAMTAMIQIHFQRPSTSWRIGDNFRSCFYQQSPARGAPRHLADHPAGRPGDRRAGHLAGHPAGRPAAGGVVAAAPESPGSPCRLSADEQAEHSSNFTSCCIQDCW